MHRFDKTRRLQTKQDYERVFSQAKKFVTPELVLLYSFNSLGYARLGLALSKKAIAKANMRNMVKRMIRESFRLRDLPAVDVVILAKPKASQTKKSLLDANLREAWEKLARV